MKNLRNKNQPVNADLVQVYLQSSWDIVLAIYAQLDAIQVVSDAIEAGDLDSFLYDTDINTLAKLNAIVADATLGDVADFATAAQGLLADNSVQLPFASQGEAEAGVDNTRPMTALRVAQAIAVLASGVQNNFAGIGVPGVLDDANAGYSAGSVWIDTSADPDESYRCTDPTAGAAVWVKTTLTSDELATVALTGNSDDLTEGATKLLLTVGERAKLTGIETAATADQSGAEIKALYEAEADTNAFTDALLTKLNATITTVVTQAEAEAGVSTTARLWTAQRVAQAIAALAGSGSGLTGVYVNTTANATAGSLILYDVNGGAFTITLPATPSDGDVIVFSQYAGLVDMENLTINRNGNTINGAAFDTVISYNNVLYLFIWDAANNTWRMSNTIPGGGTGGGGLAASVKTSNYEITESEDVGVNSSGGSFTITLKIAPSNGDVAYIRDVAQSCGTNPVTIDRNGSTINGAAVNESLNIDGGMYMFIFNGSTWVFTPVFALGGTGLAGAVKTANYTILADEDIGVDSTGGTFTVYLKNSPSVGDTAFIHDIAWNCGTTAVAIGRNGSTIAGLAEDASLDTDGGCFWFIYDGTTWQFTPITSGGLSEAEVDARIVALGATAHYEKLLPHRDLLAIGGGAPTETAVEHLSNVSGGYVHAYSSAAYLGSFFTWLPQPNWDAGTVYFRIIWRPKSTNTGVVRWRIAHSWGTEGEAMAESGATDYAVVDDTGLGVADDIQKTPWLAKNLSALDINDVITFLVQRAGGDASDTFSTTAELLAVEFVWVSTTSVISTPI